VHTGRCFRGKLTPSDSEGFRREFQASTLELTNRIKITEGIIRDALWGCAFEEKNLYRLGRVERVYRARGDTERGRRILEEHYNLEDALVISSFLNTFVNHAHIVKIANMAQLVNVIAPFSLTLRVSFFRPSTIRFSYSPIIVTALPSTY
jgi:hypothetical protein